MLLIFLLLIFLILLFILFGLARKLTFQPHLVGRADIEPLKKHYTDVQILNMISSITGFNSMNRWTDGRRKKAAIF